MQQLINAKDYENFRKYVEDGITLDDLIDIVATNDTYFIEYVITKDATIVNYLFDSNQTLLVLASASVIPILLSNGLDINHVNTRGQNALMYLCNVRYFDVACELIRNGIDIDHVDNSGETVLSYAIEINNFKLVEMSLEKGAIGIQTTLHRHITAVKSVITDLTERTKDLTMYRDFYELCHF